MFYRIKQFIWAITSNIKPIDYTILEKYLNNKEIELFKKLKISEQHHSIRVCNESIKFANEKNFKINRYKLGKVALLHDVGKSEYSINIIDKSVLVILNKISKGAIKKLNRFKKIDGYYNHPYRGVVLLKQKSIYDNEFLEVVEKHHLKLPEDNKNRYLEIVKICDDKS